MEGSLFQLDWVTQISDMNSPRSKFNIHVRRRYGIFILRGCGSEFFGPKLKLVATPRTFLDSSSCKYVALVRKPICSLSWVFLNIFKYFEINFTLIHRTIINYFLKHIFFFFFTIFLTLEKFSLNFRKRDDRSFLIQNENSLVSVIKQIGGQFWRNWQCSAYFDPW